MLNIGQKLLNFINMLSLMRQYDHLLRYGYRPEETLFDLGLIGNLCRFEFQKAKDLPYTFIPLKISNKHLWYLTSDAIKATFLNYDHFSSRYYPHNDECHFMSRGNHYDWNFNSKQDTRLLNQFNPFSHIVINFTTDQVIRHLQYYDFEYRIFHKSLKKENLSENDKVNLFILKNLKNDKRLFLMSKTDNDFTIIVNERGQKITNAKKLCHYLGRQIKKYVESRQKHNTG